MAKWTDARRSELRSKEGMCMTWSPDPVNVEENEENECEQGGG